MTEAGAWSVRPAPSPACGLQTNPTRWRRFPPRMLGLYRLANRSIQFGVASFVWVRGGARFCFLLRNVSSSQRCLSINNRIIIKWTNVLLDIPVVAMATSELPVQISNEPATPRRARFCLSWPQLSLQLSVWTLLLWARGHLSLSEKCGPPSRNSQVAWHCWLCNPTPAGHSKSFITELAEKWLILALSHH